VSLDYNRGFVRLQIHMNFDTIIYRQQPGRVVDRGGDNAIESFVVQPLCIGLVDPYIVWVVSSFGLDPPG
jgi:hypothetical protein